MNPIKSFANQVLELRAKKVEIELDINKSLSARELAQRDAVEALQNVEAIRKDISELDNALSELISNSSSIADSCKDISVEYLKTIRDAASVVSEYVTSILELQNKVIEAKNEFEQVKKDQESAWENIRNESAKLATFKDDLDVYKKRLEKLRDKVVPSMNIIV